MSLADKLTRTRLLALLAILAGLFLGWFAWPFIMAARHRLTAISGERVTELIKASAWPLLIATSLLLLRNQLGAFATAIASRANKLSIMNLEIELAQSTQLQAWPTPAIQGIKEADSAVLAGDSSVSLLQELHGTPADFVVVNLGQGNEWLTSRIYVLATLLRRMRSLRAIVFLTGTPSHDHLFLGIILPDRLRTRFDYHYPWLGETLQSQYAEILRFRAGPPPDHLEPFEAQRILSMYIEDLRKEPDTGIDEGWVQLRPGVAEHAIWVDAGRLTKVLGSDLDRSAIEWKPTLTKDDARDVLGKNGPFVALVDRDGNFRDALIDRVAMVEAVAKEVATHS